MIIVIDKMLPEPIPALTGKSAEEFERKISEPTSEATINLFQKAEEVFNKIKYV